MIKRKLANTSGMSVVFALVIFLFCTLVSTFIVQAAASNSMRTGTMKKEEQARLAATSAAVYLRSRLDGMRLTYVLGVPDGGTEYKRVSLIRQPGVEVKGSVSPYYFTIENVSAPVLSETDEIAKLTPYQLDAPALPDSGGTEQTRTALETMLLYVADKGYPVSTGEGSFANDWRIAGQKGTGSKLGNELNLTIHVSVGPTAAEVPLSLDSVTGDNFSLLFSLIKAKPENAGPGGLRDDYRIELRADAVCDVTDGQIITGWTARLDEFKEYVVRWDPTYETVKIVTVKWPAERMSIEKAGA